MTRTLLFAALLGMYFGANVPLIIASPLPYQTPSQTPQQSPKPGEPIAQQVPDETNLPEEDETVAPEKFVLNPLESDRNVRIGNFYWHKNKFRAALKRYEWATRYNPSSAEAFFKVGEAQDKLNNKDAAKLAYQKVLALAPDSKVAHEAKKKISKS